MMRRWFETHLRFLFRLLLLLVLLLLRRMGQQTLALIALLVLLPRIESLPHVETFAVEVRSVLHFNGFLSLLFGFELHKAESSLEDEAKDAPVYVEFLLQVVRHN